MGTNLLLDEGWRYNATGPGSANWREKMRVLWQYLHRDMTDAREQRKILYPKTWTSHVQRVVPFIWRVAREMASMKRARSFVDPVTREPLPEATQDLIRMLYAEAGVDSAMQAAYGQLVTLNQSTVWLLPRGSGLRCVTMAPHDQPLELADPMATHEDDVFAWRLLVPVEQDIHIGAVRYATARFTEATIEWLEPFAAEYPPPFGDANPFGRIPVTFLAGQDREPGLWWCHAPEDLLDAQRAINHDMTDLGHIARLQGYGQMYAAGLSPGEADNVEIGPERLIALMDPTARLDYARAQPDLSGYATQNEQYLRAVISAEGMNPATFLKSAGITALAKKMEQIDRDAERQKYLGELERAEQRVYDLMRDFYNTTRGAELLPAARVEVEFREPVVPADPLHDAQAIELLNRLGLVGLVASRAKLEGISVEEAAARIERDRRMDEAAMGSVAAPEPADDPMPVEVPEDAPDAQETGDAGV